MTNLRHWNLHSKGIPLYESLQTRILAFSLAEKSAEDSSVSTEEKRLHCVNYNNTRRRRPIKLELKGLLRCRRWWPELMFNISIWWGRVCVWSVKWSPSNWAGNSMLRRCFQQTLSRCYGRFEYALCEWYLNRSLIRLNIVQISKSIKITLAEPDNRSVSVWWMVGCAECRLHEWPDYTSRQIRLQGIASYCSIEQSLAIDISWQIDCKQTTFPNHLN